MMLEELQRRNYSDYPCYGTLLIRNRQETDQLSVVWPFYRSIWLAEDKAISYAQVLQHPPMPVGV